MVMCDVVFNYMFLFHIRSLTLACLCWTHFQSSVIKILFFQDTLRVFLGHGDLN